MSRENMVDQWPGNAVVVDARSGDFHGCIPCIPHHVVAYAPSNRSTSVSYWLIVLLDLGVYVPVATLVGIGLQRAASGWFALVTVAVAAMSAADLADLADLANLAAPDAALAAMICRGRVMVERSEG